MHSAKPANQSFSSWNTEDVEKHAYEAAEKGDIESLSYCLAELSPKHRNIALTAWLNITEFAQERGLRVGCLPRWYDVDTVAELDRLANDLRLAPDDVAPRTRRFLQDFEAPIEPGVSESDSYENQSHYSGSERS